MLDLKSVTPSTWTAPPVLYSYTQFHAVMHFNQSQNTSHRGVCRVASDHAIPGPLAKWESCMSRQSTDGKRS